MLLAGITSLGVVTYFLFIWRAVHNEGQEHRGTAFWRIVISYFMVNMGLANGIAARMPPALTFFMDYVQPMEALIYIFDPSTALTCLARTQFTRLEAFLATAARASAWSIPASMAPFAAAARDST